MGTLAPVSPASAARPAGGRSVGCIIQGMVKPRTNPFRPGAGRFPPLRAGHDEASEYLSDGLDELGNNEGGDTVVLYGPRGNGKTALLGELRRRAKRRKVRIIGLQTGEMAPSSATLPKLLAAETASPRRKVKGAKAHAFEFGGGVELEDPEEPSATEALRRHLNKPLLLLVDEAHEMPTGFGKILLQAAQDCVNAGSSLLLVLAGTPVLPAHLGKMHASFLERCEKLRIGRLETDEAVREALATPAKNSRMPIDEDALGLLVAESQRYPFFVQKLGRESWNAAHKRKGTRRITAADAEKGISIVRRKLRTFYGDRRRETDKQSVLSEAEAVSRAVIGKKANAPLLTTAELVAAVEDAATPNGWKPSKTLERLAHLGVVWETSEPDYWEPGIPSFCSYLVEKQGVPVPE